MDLRRLTVADVAAYRALRLRGLRECPTAFGASYAEEKNKPASVLDDRLRPSPDSFTYGAFEGNLLLGVVSLVRSSRQKERHKADIYGLYVAPEARREGTGRRLIEACLARARAMRGVRQVRICVEATNQAAARLYRRLGFVEYGREVDALKVAGRYYDEVLLVLALAEG